MQVRVVLVEAEAALLRALVVPAPALALFPLALVVLAHVEAPLLAAQALVVRVPVLALLQVQVPVLALLAAGLTPAPQPAFPVAAATGRCAARAACGPRPAYRK